MGVAPLSSPAWLLLASRRSLICSLSRDTLREILTCLGTETLLNRRSFNTPFPAIDPPSASDQAREEVGALRSTIQFADLLQRGAYGPGSDNYFTAGVYSSFELMVRAHGRSQTSLYLKCSLFSEALGLPQGAYLDFLRSREWEVAAGRYRALFAAFRIQAQDILLRLTHWRLYIGSHVQPYLAGLDGEWEERLTRWTLAVQTALEEDVELPLFCLLYTSPSPRDRQKSRMPSSA